MWGWGLSEFGSMWLCLKRLSDLKRHHVHVLTAASCHIGHAWNCELWRVCAAQDIRVAPLYACSVLDLCA